MGVDTRRIDGLRIGAVADYVAIVGLAIGIPVAYATSHLVESFLFGMKPNDPTALILAVATLLSAAFLASYFPARKASRIDPLVALRHE